MADSMMDKVKSGDMGANRFSDSKRFLSEKVQAVEPPPKIEVASVAPPAGEINQRIADALKRAADKSGAHGAVRNEKYEQEVFGIK